MNELDFSAFESTAQLLEADGKPLNCGWIPPDRRTTAGENAHAYANNTIPKLTMSGKGVNENATKVCLWDCWDNSWTGIRQLTGACVGCGGGNALYSLAAADIKKRKDRERLEVPFWLLPYGKSRELGGMNDRGEGSFGSTFAQAVREVGHLPANTEGLPPYKQDDGFVWGQKAELDWSYGRGIATKYLNESRKYLVQSTARCTSFDDVRNALKNYYPCTCASDWGGMMRPPVAGGDVPVLLNKRTGRWMHQLSFHGWMDHPSLGEIVYVMNTWGLETHGRCPSGAPAGGFWILRADVEYMIRQEEVYAFSSFDGFPVLEEPLDFSAF